MNCRRYLFGHGRRCICLRLSPCPELHDQYCRVRQGCNHDSQHRRLHLQERFQVYLRQSVIELLRQLVDFQYLTDQHCIYGRDHRNLPCPWYCCEEGQCLSGLSRSLRLVGQGWLYRLCGSLSRLGRHQNQLSGNHAVQRYRDQRLCGRLYSRRRPDFQRHCP